MDTTPFEAESTLTDRYQTTIPELVRKALKAEKRDKIHYSILPNGQVVITVIKQPEDDPLLGTFLSFLGEDINKNPQNIQSVSSDMLNQIQSLVAGTVINLDAPLSDEDE
jgi:antitoxin PrlF